jgi:hypothetical protein
MLGKGEISSSEVSHTINFDTTGTKSCGCNSRILGTYNNREGTNFGAKTIDINFASPASNALDP